MNKTMLTFVLAALTSPVIAGEHGVIKDTRQYMPYTASLDKEGTCSIAADPDRPKAGDCHEVRGKMPVAGEYIVRDGTTCRKDSYSMVNPAATTIAGRPVPTIHISTRTFRCDAHGNAV